MFSQRIELSSQLYNAHTFSGTKFLFIFKQHSNGIEQNERKIKRKII